jgi:hypothetical protein
MMTIKKQYQQPTIEVIGLDLTGQPLLADSPVTEIVELDETTIVNIEDQD